MLDARRTLELLLDGRDLAEEQAAGLLHALTRRDLPAAMAGALLAALRAKGVTSDELRGLAQAMRSLARAPRLRASNQSVDIVGTGGDASGSYNLSTGAALLAAACGLPVIKHGNRSISSRSGSADLIEQFGFVLPLDEAEAAHCFEATGFTFLFAPYYHPAMRAISPVRAALGIRTVFNLLGPLTNPASPAYLLIGAHDVDTARLIAGSVAGTAAKRAFVIHGAQGWDEATPLGPFTVFDVRGGAIDQTRMDPQELGLAPCTVRELTGGDAAANFAALMSVFDGSDRGAHRDALLLQCGLALALAEKAPSARAGIELAAAVLDTGRALDWLGRLRSLAGKSRTS